MWVFVCGASGAGKDSVLGAARALLQGRGIVFATRVVTREGTGGNEREVHPAAFERLRAAGEFAWHWAAHGLQYGIPAGYAPDAARGVVVVNGSREHAASIIGHDDVRIVLVSAPAQLLEQRLQARAREGAGAIAERLARNRDLPALAADCTIRNDGDLQAAAHQLAAYLESLA